MRQTLIILFTITLTLHSYSQTYDTIFYNSDDIQVTNQEYRYYQIISKIDGLNYSVIENYKGDSLKAKYILKSYAVLDVNDENLYSLIKRHGFIKVDSAANSSRAYVMYYPNESEIIDSLSFNENETIYTLSEDMPNFNGGGIDEFRIYVAKSLRYPEVAAMKGINGRVFIQFVVDRNGVVQNVEMIRSTDPLLDEEALRVIKDCPRWEPGTKDGKRVSVQFTMPIVFVHN